MCMNSYPNENIHYAYSYRNFEEIDSFISAQITQSDTKGCYNFDIATFVFSANHVNSLVLKIQ